jgi:hypothetical protein
VKYSDAVSLLALNFGDGMPRAPFLLQDIADQKCLQLGKPEFRFTYPNPTIGSSPGHLVLGSSGAAIIGRVGGIHEQAPTEESWLISTGEATDMDRASLRPTAWEVGVTNAAGVFEKVLSFRDGQFISAS